MRIVFVTTFPPSPRTPRAYGFLTTLARRHSVTAICLYHCPRDVEDITRLRAAGIAVIPVYDERARPLSQALGAFLGDRPLPDGLQALRQVVERQVQAGDVSVVHAEGLAAAVALVDINAPLVWDAVTSASLEQRLISESGRFGRLRERLTHERARVRAKELVALAGARCAIAATDYERLALLGAARANADDGDCACETPVQVVPSGVDLDWYSVVPGRRHANRLVYLVEERRALAAANVEHLLREIMPRVWAERPDVQLTIVGARRTRRLRALARDTRVTVTGHVADRRPYLSGAALYVNPAAVALGIESGMLEAMAVGTPVVTLEAGVAGLGAIPGRDLLVASSADRCAQLITRALADDQLWRSLARSGRVYVERHHAWPLATHQLEAIYRSVTKRNRALMSVDAAPPALVSPGANR